MGCSVYIGGYPAMAVLPWLAPIPREVRRRRRRKGYARSTTRSPPATFTAALAMLLLSIVIGYAVSIKFGRIQRLRKSRRLLLFLCGLRLLLFMKDPRLFPL